MSHLQRILSCLALCAASGASACAPQVTIDGRVATVTDERDQSSAGEERVAENSSVVSEGASTDDKRNWLERIRHRDAVVIERDDEVAKRASFGTLIQVNPPGTSLPGWQ